MRPWNLLITTPRQSRPLCFESHEQADIERRWCATRGVTAIIVKVDGPEADAENMPETMMGWFRVAMMKWRRG